MYFMHIQSYHFLLVKSLGEFTFEDFNSGPHFRFSGFLGTLVRQLPSWVGITTTLVDLLLVHLRYLIISLQNIILFIVCIASMPSHSQGRGLFLFQEEKVPMFGVVP